MGFAQQGDLPLVKSLLRLGADINRGTGVNAKIELIEWRLKKFVFLCRSQHVVYVSKFRLHMCLRGSPAIIVCFILFDRCVSGGGLGFRIVLTVALRVC